MTIHVEVCTQTCEHTLVYMDGCIYGDVCVCNKHIPTGVGLPHKVIPSRRTQVVKKKLCKRVVVFFFPMSHLSCIPLPPTV